MKVEINSLNCGDKFMYGRKRAIVLDYTNDYTLVARRGILCMVLDEDYRTEFDKDSNTCFSNSTLFKDLNGRYFEEWQDDGANPLDFVEMRVNLIADDGRRDYGNVGAFLAPRTCKQHREYREVIPECEQSEWTATAVTTLPNFSAVRDVKTQGFLGYDNAKFTKIVRPLFKLKPEVLVRTIEEDNGLAKEINELVELYGIANVVATVQSIFEIKLEEKRRED